MLAQRRPGRHDVERLVQQVRSLEAQSGRPAVHVQVEIPVNVDGQYVEEALRENLGPTIDIDVQTASRAQSCRVVTVDFVLLGNAP